VFQAKGHHLILKRCPIKTKTDSGIITVATEQEKKMQEANQALGLVVDIGPTAFKGFREIVDNKWVNGTRWVNEGDMVIATKYGGASFPDPADPEEFYWFVNDEDIVAVVHEDITQMQWLKDHDSETYKKLKKIKEREG
jgi:co-chaperonin GroES (HSP10)